MKYLNLLLFVLFTSLMIVSCQDSDVNLDTSFNSPPDSEFCFGFTQEELESIGTFHNQYLITVYQNIDFNACTDCDREVIHEYKQLDIDVSDLNVTLDELINKSVDIYNNLENNDARLWTNSPLNNTTQNYVNSILDLFDNSNQYTDFIQNLEALQIDANGDSNLSCLNLEIVTATIEVAKNSAYLWMPEDAGGLDFYSIANPNLVQTRWSWRDAFAGDVGAVAASMFELAGVMAASTAFPPGNGIIALGIGINAGVGSALAGAAG